MKQISKAYIFAFLSVILWSTVATAFKLALKHLSPIELILIATIVSLITFFVVILFQRKLKLLFQVSLNDMGKSAILGALNPFSYYLILFEAYSSYFMESYL